MFAIFNKRAKQGPPEAATAADADTTATAMTANVPTPADEATGAAEERLPTHGLDVGALTAPSASTTSVVAFGPVDADRTDELKPALVDAISTVFDPEIPVNIYELGLIYEVSADAESRVQVRMTLTSPACPSAQQLPSEVRFKCKAVPGVADCNVDIVWEPPWTKDMMSEAAKLSLGMF